jgi:hypothetical protein
MITTPYSVESTERDYKVWSILEGRKAFHRFKKQHYLEKDVSQGSYFARSFSSHDACVLNVCCFKKIKSSVASVFKRSFHNNLEEMMKLPRKEEVLKKLGVL